VKRAQVFRQSEQTSPQAKGKGAKPLSKSSSSSQSAQLLAVAEGCEKSARSISACLSSFVSFFFLVFPSPSFDLLVFFFLVSRAANILDVARDIIYFNQSSCCKTSSQPKSNQGAPRGPPLAIFPSGCVSLLSVFPYVAFTIIVTGSPGSEEATGRRLVGRMDRPANLY
jgi:hypothetical protein